MDDAEGAAPTRLQGSPFHPPKRGAAESNHKMFLLWYRAEGTIDSVVLFMKFYRNEGAKFHEKKQRQQAEEKSSSFGLFALSLFM